MREHRRTVNIYCGKKLSGKSRDEILRAILGKFQNVEAVQQKLDVIRVSFNAEEHALAALREKGLRLFDMWCRMDGGPPTTIVHLFDYPYEDPAGDISAFFADFGVVKGVRHQKYLRNGDIATGTRLVDIVLSRTPPRLAIINGSTCRVWYRGQPILCNICATLGHKAVNCPYKNKCRLCQQEGHFARNCPNPWGINVSDSSQGSSCGAPADGETSRNVDPSGSQDSPGAPTSDGAHLVSSLDAGSPGAHTPPQVVLPGGSSDPPVGPHVRSAVHDSSNCGAQSGSSLDAGSSGVQTSPQAIPPPPPPVVLLILQLTLALRPKSSNSSLASLCRLIARMFLLMRQTVLTLTSFLSLLFVLLRPVLSSLRVRAFFAMPRMFKTIVLFRGLLSLL